MTIKMSDLQKMSKEKTHEGFGYIGHEVRFEQPETTQALLDVLNEHGATYESAFAFLNSVTGRKLGDQLEETSPKKVKKIIELYVEKYGPDFGITN